MSIETLLSRYHLAARAEGLSEKTVESKKLAMRLFASFLGGIDDVRQVQADDLRRFIIGLQERTRWPGMPQSRNSGSKLSKTTVNTYSRAIKGFYSWLARERIIEDNPLAAVPAPKLPKLLPKIYSEDELKAVFKAAAQNPRDSAMLQLFLDSGIRLSELAGLEPGDIDLETGTVRVYGKGGKERPAFFSPQTALAIQIYLVQNRPTPAAADKVFLTVDGYPMSPGRVQKVMERIGVRAGIGKRLSPHKLRHTYATLSLKNGCNLEYLRRLLGHSDAKVTQVYLHLISRDLHDAHKSFSPVRNLLGNHGGQGMTVVGGREYQKNSPEFFEAMRRQKSC